MKHFSKLTEAKKHRDQGNKFNNELKVFKKIKGHKDRFKKPFVVGTDLQFLNLN
jgi:hypothetical protein